MSLVSEAGSRRASAFEAVSVCPLVTSVKSQAAAATDGAGTPARTGQFIREQQQFWRRLAPELDIQPQ